VPIEASEEPEKPDKLAIRVPGGFDVCKPKEKIEEECSLAVVPPGTLVPLPCPDLPAPVLESIISIQVRRIKMEYRCINLPCCVEILSKTSLLLSISLCRLMKVHRLRLKQKHGKKSAKLANMLMIWSNYHAIGRYLWIPSR
jgi:hypothetical protein